jgi:hypothetical protein
MQTPQTPAYENLQAKQPQWLPYIEQCARERTTTRLPSLEVELGPGRWKLVGAQPCCIPKTHKRYRLQWCSASGTFLTLGCFDAPRPYKPAGLRVVDEIYRAVVERCESASGSIEGLPSLECSLGAGHYKAEHGGIRKDNRWLCILYWVTSERRSYIRLGSFHLSATGSNKSSKPKSRIIERRGMLGMGVDELGRKIIRCGAGPNSDMYLAIAVEYECIRGEWMPRPAHDKIAQAFQV